MKVEELKGILKNPNHCCKYLAKLISGCQIAIFLARGWQKNQANLIKMAELQFVSKNYKFICNILV